MTIALLVAMAVFTIPLVYRIALLNDSFDRNAGLLKAQKTKHQDRQRRREKLLTDKCRELNQSKKKDCDDDASESVDVDIDEIFSVQKGLLRASDQAMSQ